MDGDEGRTSKTSGGKEYPRRLFRPGNEPQVKQINNSCRMSILTKIKEALPHEYETVKSDPVFAQVFAIHENGLGYSARLIHSLLCRQLVTKKKHELWFVFGRKPLRFSLQEFSAVTGLKYVNDFSCDLENWVDDKGFWSKAVKRKAKISIKRLLNVDILEAHKWEDADRIRFVYLCVIVGLVMARDEKKYIPITYMKLVMDLGKLRAYPWGFHAFELLVSSVNERREDLTNPKSYSLDGFSYALQIWAMEAIPLVGELLGGKINKELLDTPRCSNWKGAAKVSYQDIILLEDSHGPKDIVYPFISDSGNNDLVEAMEFLIPGEFNDGLVRNLLGLIQSGYDFGDFVWGIVETEDVDEETNSDDVECDDFVEGHSELPQVEKEVPNANEVLETSEMKEDINIEVSGSKRKRKKPADHGAETRKTQLLFHRAANTNGNLEEMKSYIKVLFENSFRTFGDEIGKRLDKLDDDVSEVKESVSTLSKLITTTVAQPTSPKKTVEEKFVFDNIFTETGEIDLNMGTQDFLDKSIGHLRQSLHVPEFDPTQDFFRKDEEVRPSETKRKKNEETGPVYDPDAGANDEDAVLVFVPEKKWTVFEEWQRNLDRQSLRLGPSVVNDEFLNRIITRTKWLGNEEVDAMMYLFREKTSLGLMKSERVGFMDCMFSMRIKNEHLKYLKTPNKRSHKWDSNLLAYANGDLPSHGKTGKKWAKDFDRIYAPVFVHGNHWISICVNFVQRTVEVFDCAGKNNRRNVESFAVCVPRILKEVHQKEYGKAPLLTQYDIVDVKVPNNLNALSCHCGVYALKYIECHMLQLGMDLMTDDNIRGARQKIAYDLWEAAHDPILIERLKNYQPPQLSSEKIDID